MLNKDMRSQSDQSDRIVIQWREAGEHKSSSLVYPRHQQGKKTMRITTMALAGALALSSTFALAQSSGGTAGGGSAGGSVTGGTTTGSSSGNTTGGTAGSSTSSTTSGRMGPSSTNPSGNTLAPSGSPSGSTLTPTGPGSGIGR